MRSIANICAEKIYWWIYPSFDTAGLVLTVLDLLLEYFGAVKSFFEVPVSLTNFPIQVEQNYGGIIFLGEHVDVKYFLQPESSSHLPIEDSGDVNKLKSLWNKSTSPEIVEPDASPNVHLHLVKTVHQKQKALQLHRVESLNHRWKSTLELLSSWQCQKCPYGSSLLPHHNPNARSNEPTYAVPTPLLQPAAICALANLTDDCMYELSRRMPSESLISFCRAYPRFHAVVDSYHVLLRRELNCFFLRVPLNECVLGIGIALDRKPRSLSSDFDWLSMEAFDRHYVRRSIEKRDFDFFLPLAFSPGNFQAVTPEIWARLALIDQELCNAEVETERRTLRKGNRRTQPVSSARPYDAVEVLYRMMNTIVVSLMRSCDDNMDSKLTTKTLLFASEKAVTSYCLLLHLLMCLCRSQPEILSNATDKLEQFIQEAKTRLKRATPDLGELIIIINLVLMMPPVNPAQPITWERVRGPFLQEAFTRNVRWILKDAPELHILETGPSDYRVQTTFDCSKTSLRLIMFQVTFLNVFLETYGAEISRLDENYGFADKGMPERMVREIKDIYRVQTWPGFFEKVNFGKTLSKAQFSEMLRDTVKDSGRKGYHEPAPPLRIREFAKKRARLDKEFSISS